MPKIIIFLLIFKEEYMGINLEFFEKSTKMRISADNKDDFNKVYQET